MKYLGKKLLSTFLTVVLLCVLCAIPVFAATVGDQLLQPEDGWKRYDDRYSLLKYTNATNFSGEFYNGTMTSWNTGSCSFKFRGTKLRIIGSHGPDDSWNKRNENISISIDGTIQTFSQNSNISTHQVISYEMLNLENKIHEVVISSSGSSTDYPHVWTYIDAIDIDDTGSLLSFYQPMNLKAIPGDSKATLSWDPIPDATGYKIKWGTVSGNYTDSLTVPNSVYTGYDVTGLTEGTYYFVVSAIVDGTEKEESDEVSATIKAPEGNKAVLVITMQNGLEKEYDLYMTEVKDFINWYNDRASGTGSPYYIINKNYNVGPFVSRKDYLVFDKIMCFEIMEYTEKKDIN